MRRSALAGLGGYGFCRSHSRWFWGFRLYLLCAPDGLPVGFELAPANAPERRVAAELLERALRPGQTVIADKGFAGAVRQWIESTFETLKGQLSLERHGGRTLTGLVSRIARRLLALTATILHNWQLGTPGGD